MKPEEKYFVVRGVREDFERCRLEEGFWVCRKGKGTRYLGFSREKEEAERVCEKYREKYELAIKNIKEGDIVWFVNGYYIQCRKVIEITNIGFDMYYYMEETDSLFKGDHLFKTKQELFEYLNNHINE